IDSIVTILTSPGSIVNDEDVVHYAVEGLSEKYNQVCGYMHYQETFLGLKPMRSLFITEDMRLKSKADSLLMDSFSPMALMTESGNSHRSSSTPQVNPLKPCFHFAKGTCRFGDRCRFIHDANMKNTNNHGVVTKESTTEELRAKLLERLARDGAAEDTSDISLDIKRTHEMIDEFKKNLEEAHESLSQLKGIHAEDLYDQLKNVLQKFILKLKGKGIVVTVEALIMFHLEFHDEEANLLKAEFIQVGSQIEIAEQNLIHPEKALADLKSQLQGIKAKQRSSGKELTTLNRQ
nr:hybrid signal transduction histidine kinase M [Tanacetum cinerariifolium]